MNIEEHEKLNDDVCFENMGEHGKLTMVSFLRTCGQHEKVSFSSVKVSGGHPRAQVQ